jgi:hypothetical protein
MQAQRVQIEREALRRLPKLFRDLLDEPDLDLQRDLNNHVDFSFIDSRGRRWLVDVKASSGPGRIAEAAQELEFFARDQDGVPLLVVPYMTKAGARRADEIGVNWIDLAGNASIKAENLYVWVQGRPNPLQSRGRPSSPFAPRSSRVTRVLLLDPIRWWRQRELVKATQLDDGTVSRVVRRLDEERFLERLDNELRPRDPDLLLDAWAEHYRFDRHDIIPAHATGSGIEVARSISSDLGAAEVHHAFTGLSAAWAIDEFARFRLTSVYVDGDPREVVDRLNLRPGSKGANVQVIGPDDRGAFFGEYVHNELNCVSPVQVYLDLLHLPERADEAARHLRANHLWRHGAA